MINLSQVRAIYVAYAQIKLSLEDWRAVRDIAAELEILDARIKCEASHPVYPQPTDLDARTS